MIIPFFKMHGLGNDFVIVDERTQSCALTPARIAALSNRHMGIGCDQFVVLRAPIDPVADVFVHFFNADGSESGACGNASRCIADLIWRESGKIAPVLQTRAGLLAARIGDAGMISVDMGTPRLDWRDVPLARAVDTLHLPVDGDPAACSMGNPHATFFVDDLDRLDPTRLGPALEHHPIFPERANIGFARVLGSDRLRLRVWERGSGLTLACGSGACATVVNAARRGLTGRRVHVEMDGGALLIEWRDDDHVWMQGLASMAFEGRVDLDSYPS